MRFTAQEEYGLRCLLQIGGAPDGFMTIKEIAMREALTTAYVAKLMRVLRKAQLVTSTRGKNGGYQLSRPPESIDVATVLTALGGPLRPRDFCDRFAGTQKTCVHDVRCNIKAMWSSIDRAVYQALSQTRLSDLIRGEPMLPILAPSQPQDIPLRTLT